MEEYFNLRYEFDRDSIDQAIDRRLKSPGAGYICVSDGVVLDNVNKHPDYRRVVNGSMFSLCDSSWVPLYLRWIYGIERQQYCGHDFFRHIVGTRKYRMMFLGSSQKVLGPLRDKLIAQDPRIADMKFAELPFADVDGFDYKGIADMINADRPDIIWISLGAPKQEQFMSRLAPYLHHGVLISVGAVFKFVSGVDAHRAPRWMVRAHMEFIHRLMVEPRKQSRRAFSIIRNLPGLLISESRRKRLAAKGN